ncbi:MAG: hypothetical protein RIE31_00465 [Alphaproteobacteria bacterium]
MPAVAPTVLRTLAVMLALVAGAIAGPAIAQDAPPPAAPHLDGDAYLALRGDTAFEALAFTVTITRGNEERRLEVLLGPDAVIERQGLATRLFDFRQRRILTVLDGERPFTSTSLFGDWFMSQALLRHNLGATASLVAAGVLPQTALNRFWLEQTVGSTYALDIASDAMPSPQFRASSAGAGTRVVAEGVNVATIAPGGVEFPSPSHRATFAAWLVWKPHLHPEVASAVIASGHIPERIERLTQRLGIDVEPVVETLAFSQPTVVQADLSVFAGRPAASLAWDPFIPAAMADLMVSAARGEAAGGPLSDADYESRIRALVNSGRGLDAFMRYCPTTAASIRACLRSATCWRPWGQWRGRNCRSMSTSMPSIPMEQAAMGRRRAI